jgi:outer membrane murein-binding lipoprotein Lpp
VTHHRRFAPARPECIRPAQTWIAIAAVAAIAIGLAGCSSKPDSTADRISSWASSTGLTSGIDQIKTDAAGVAKVEKIGSPGAIRANCAVLDLDTETANQNLPSPDTQLTQDLSDAYTAEIQAAQDCYHGAGKSSELINRGRIAQTAAYSDIATSLSLFAQLTGGSD